VTPTKDPKKSFSKHRQQGAPKINAKKDKKTTLRINAEPSIHTMKVRMRSSLPPKHPSLSLDLTSSSQASPLKNWGKWRTKMEKTNELVFQELAAIHPLNEYIWWHPKD
jgi:hypothetical protein